MLYGSEGNCRSGTALTMHCYDSVVYPPMDSKANVRNMSTILCLRVLPLYLVAGWLFCLASLDLQLYIVGEVCKIVSSIAVFKLCATAYML